MLFFSRVGLMRFHLVSGSELALMKAGEWVWSVTRECGHEKVHALVVSLRTKRRKKKKTEREERRRRKVGLTHACPKTESAGRVKTAASSPIVGNGCACRLSGTLAALHFPTKPRERESVCVCCVCVCVFVCVRERKRAAKSHHVVARTVCAFACA